MFEVRVFTFILSLKNSFLKKKKKAQCLTIKEQERVKQWTNQTREKIWVSIEVLPPGNQLEWPIW
jgi:hypothetical protein